MSTQAEMQAMAEREMPGGVAVDVEAVGLVEPGWITVCRGVEQQCTVE
jgi:hypothetical protein